MNKIFRPVAILAVLALLSTGCSKEGQELEMNARTTAEAMNVYMIRYTVDGVQHHVKLHGEAEHAAFIYNMLTLAEQGHSVSFCDETKVSQQSYAKETVTFTTSNKIEAYNWAFEMEQNGYTVSVSYNPDTNVFTCIAIK